MIICKALSVWVQCSVKGTDKATAILIKHHATKAAGSRGTAPLMFKFTVRLLYPIENRHKTH